MTTQALVRDSSSPLRLSLLLGSLYFVTLAWQPYPGSAAVKGLSIATLAWLAWSAGVRPLALGLAASSLGDVLLDIRSINLFIPGLILFLVAHLVYASMFLRAWQYPLRIWERQRILVGGVILYSLCFAIWLAPGLGALAIPVTLYICAITAMVVTSVVADVAPRVIAGAVLFLVSDSLLAIAKFKGTFALRDYAVWGTYYLAQYCIATGVLRSPRLR
jgi:uncharacterized membrane protein YhhN